MKLGQLTLQLLILVAGCYSMADGNPFLGVSNGLLGKQIENAQTPTASQAEQKASQIETHTTHSVDQKAPIIEAASIQYTSQLENESTLTPFHLFPRPFFHPANLFMAPVFTADVMSVWWLALSSVAKYSLDYYDAVTASVLLFFGIMTTYDCLHLISYDYLQKNSSVVGILVSRVVILFSYGAWILKMPLYFPEKLTRSFFFASNFGTAMVYNIFLILSPKDDEISSFYAYANIPWMVDFINTVFLAEKEQQHIFLDDVVGVLEEWENSSLKIVLDVASGSLWISYVVLFLAKSIRKKLFKASYFQFLWIGFGFLYTIPSIAGTSISSENLQKLSVVYFNTIPLRFISSHVEPYVDMLREHRFKVVLVLGSIIPFLPFRSYLAPASEFTLALLPSSFKRGFYKEFKFLIEPVRFLIDLKYVHFVASILGYILLGAVIYDSVFHRPISETLFKMYTTSKTTTDLLKGKWDEAYEEAKAHMYKASDEPATEAKESLNIDIKKAKTKIKSHLEKVATPPIHLF